MAGMNDKVLVSLPILLFCACACSAPPVVPPPVRTLERVTSEVVDDQLRIETAWQESRVIILPYRDHRCVVARYTQTGLDAEILLNRQVRTCSSEALLHQELILKTEKGEKAFGSDDQGQLQLDLLVLDAQWLPLRLPLFAVKISPALNDFAVSLPEENAAQLAMSRKRMDDFDAFLALYAGGPWHDRVKAARQNRVAELQAQQQRAIVQGDQALLREDFADAKAAQEMCDSAGLPHGCEDYARRVRDIFVAVQFRDASDALARRDIDRAYHALYLCRIIGDYAHSPEICTPIRRLIGHANAEIAHAIAVRAVAVKNWQAARPQLERCLQYDSEFLQCQHLLCEVVDAELAQLVSQAQQAVKRRQNDKAKLLALACVQKCQLERCTALNQPAYTQPICAEVCRAK